MIRRDSQIKYRLTPEQAYEVIKKIRQAIQQYFRENRLSYAIFGKSEGIDSSVIAGLLSNLEEVKPIGVIMPCESDPEAERIAKLVLNHFQIPWIRVDLTQEFHFIMSKFYHAEGLYPQLINALNHYGDSQTIRNLPLQKARAAGNIKARLRMITLYHIARLVNGIVVSTDNLSEFYMGFWTINGDVGDICPIQYIFKGLEEYTIAKALGVPQESLNAIPTDGLDVIPGGTDQDQLGLPYQDLDRVIIKLLQNRLEQMPDLKDCNTLFEQIASELGYSLESITHVAHQMFNTKFKRNWPRVITREEAGLPPIKAINKV